MKGWVFTIGWGLLGLLAIAAVLLAAGRQESTPRPDPGSYFPSGVSALYNLLAQRGYRVIVDHTMTPPAHPNEAVLGFEVGAEQDQFNKGLQAVEKAGGLVVWLPLEDSFMDASRAARAPTPVTTVKNEKLSISRDPSFAQRYDNAVTRLDVPPPPSDDSSMALATDHDSNPLVQLDQSGKGAVVKYDDGIGLTNRFIDVGDNARFLLETLGAFVPPGGTVVFTTAGFGDVENPGILESIGPWAQASWFQALFFLAVIVFTLNRRFGLPEMLRARQRGSRELLDAVSGTYTRARATGVGLSVAGSIADARIRRHIKLPRDASDGERDRLLPEALARALAQVKAAATIPKTSPRDALTLIQRLEQELTAFHPEPAHIPRKRPRPI